MKKQIFALVICLIFLNFGRSISFAAPLINEFSSNTSPDWIEIYNSGNETVDLSLYRIRDLTANNKLDLSGSLEPGGFAAFDWSNKLNNSGDLIKLVLSSDESVIDQVTYGDQGGLVSPNSNQTGGRDQDGGGEWVLFESSSKGSSNNSSTVYVPPTPTPTPLPTPTKTPKPTKILTPTKSSNTSTSVKSATSVSTTTGSDKIVYDVSPSSSISGKISRSFELGTKTAKLAEKSEEKEPSDEVSVLGIKSSNISLITVLGGLIFLLIGGGLVLYKYKYDIYEKIFNRK